MNIWLNSIGKLSGPIGVETFRERYAGAFSNLIKPLDIEPLQNKDLLPDDIINLTSQTLQNKSINVNTILNNLIARYNNQNEKDIVAALGNLNTDYNAKKLASHNYEAVSPILTASQRLW